MDLSFAETFFLTYESFVEPAQLLTKFIERFAVPRERSGTLSSAQFKAQVRKDLLSCFVFFVFFFLFFFLSRCVI